MDRNLWWGVRKAVGSLVALRKESVDRNYAMQVVIVIVETSLSARRAWIEIYYLRSHRLLRWSLSARRAWIEMYVGVMGAAITPVALRKESVDRNPCFIIVYVKERGRSPQGERG